MTAVALSARPARSTLSARLNTVSAKFSQYSASPLLSSCRQGQAGGQVGRRSWWMVKKAPARSAAAVQHVALLKAGSGRPGGRHVQPKRQADAAQQQCTPRAWARADSVHTHTHVASITYWLCPRTEALRPPTCSTALSFSSLPIKACNSPVISGARPDLISNP